MLELYERTQAEVRQQWLPQALAADAALPAAIDTSARSESVSLGDAEAEVTDVLSATVQRHKHTQQLSGAREAMGEHIRWVRTLDERGRAARTGVRGTSLFCLSVDRQFYLPLSLSLSLSFSHSHSHSHSQSACICLPVCL